MSAEGIIFGIQRFSIHDGPGIRTTVFLKGCNMRCRWCHNPESYLASPVLPYNPALCADCRACGGVCQNGGHTFEDDGHFEGIAELTNRCPDSLGAELLAYHNLGVSKADRIGMEYEQFETPESSALDRWKQKVRGFGGRVLEGY